MNKSDYKRNYFMLDGRFAKKGYDWWWHNFTGVNEKTGEEKSFFIEYFTCNPAMASVNGGQNPVLGQTEENQKNRTRPSYLMVKAGWWGKDAVQLHRFIPWNKVSVMNSKIVMAGALRETDSEEKGFSLSAEDCYCSDKILKGRVEITSDECAAHPEYMCGSGSMEWDITADKQVAFNVGYGAGSLFRKLKAFEMYWHAEGMKTQYNGTIIANGEKYIVTKESSFGYADKNWGSDFTSPWVWLSSNDLTSKVTGKKLTDSVFDIGGGRPVVFGAALERKLLSDFWYEGKSYEFNFSKFWTFTKTDFDCKETDSEIIWHVRQETLSAIMETDVVCKKDEMLLVNYEAPDGRKRHNRLWNGGTGKGTVKLYKKCSGKKPELIDEIEAAHVGCEWGEYC